MVLRTFNFWRFVGQYRDFHYYFITTMCLVEQTLNARPLTSVSDDPDDLEALTPNHFLMGRANLATPFLPDAQRYTDLRRVFRVSQAYSDMI